MPKMERRFRLCCKS